MIMTCLINVFIFCLLIITKILAKDHQLHEEEGGQQYRENSPSSKHSTTYIDYYKNYIILFQKTDNHFIEPKTPNDNLSFPSSNTQSARLDNYYIPSQSSPPQITFIQHYEFGVQGYLGNDWEMCIEHLELAIAGYRDYYETITSCRIQCDYERLRFKRDKHQFEANPNGYQLEVIDNLKFYENCIRKTLCMEKCKRLLLKNVPTYFVMDNWSKEIFNNRKPYEYLQLCYYRVSYYLKAASATYTILVRDPKNKMMLDNLGFYTKKIDNFQNNMLEDMEQKKFTFFYLMGLEANNNKNWFDVIETMEKSIQQYILDENECRAFCEGEFDHGWKTDFISSISNHFTFSLRCKRNCTKDLSLIDGKYYEDIFSSHYNYLQYAYFNVGNIKDACRAAFTLSILEGSDEDVIENMKFYRNLPDVNDSYFVIRNEANNYYRRFEHEKWLLKFIDEEFMKIEEATSIYLETTTQQFTLEMSD